MRRDARLRERRLPGRRGIDAEVQLPSLLHLGVGFNLVDEDALSSIAAAFPSLTSLDLCHNGLSDTRRVLTCLRDGSPSRAVDTLRAAPHAIGWSTATSAAAQAPAEGS